MHFRAITRIVGLLVILFFRDNDSPRTQWRLSTGRRRAAFTQTFFVALAIGSLLWWQTVVRKVS